MSPKRIGAMLAALGGVYVVMLSVARVAFIPRIGPDGGEAPLWAWFLACVVVGAVLAGRLGGIGVGRGLVSAGVFLACWVLIAPLLAAAFEHYLPERPVIFGLAFGAQLVVLLPPRGAVAVTWRLAIPTVADLIASLLSPPTGGVGPRGIAVLVAAITAVWLLEARSEGRDRAVETS